MDLLVSFSIPKFVGARHKRSRTSESGHKAISAEVAAGSAKKMV